MICSKCGFKNNIHVKYCTSCGFHLNKIMPGKFSFKFGKQLTTKKPLKSSRKRFLNSYFYGIKVKAFIVLVCSLLILFSLMAVLEFLSPTHIPRFRKTEIKSKNPAVEKTVSVIASKFICSCGKCGEKSLEICKCERAIEERSLIRKRAEINEPSENIVLEVAQQYGFLKENFASNYKVDKSKIWHNNINKNNK